jgi:prevent-host-death family protein
VSIGVRELRDTLSRQLAEVQAGHVITVTDHGRPIARIVPIGVPTKLEQLIAEGKVTPGRARKGPRTPPVSAAGMVSDLIDEQRR